MAASTFPIYSLNPKSAVVTYPFHHQRLCIRSPKRIRRQVVVAGTHHFDIVVVGAGIIGLTIARQFLIGSNLSVAVVDKDIPCSGATGAGQGYIWMVHKTPGTPTWDLTMRSHQLWQMFADSVYQQGLDPQHELGWNKTGSLLIGQTQEECSKLKRRVERLSQAGLQAEYLSATDLLLKEPALLGGGAAYLPDDSQLDARRAVAFIEKGNRRFASEGRYAEFYKDPLTCLRYGTNGKVEAVETCKNLLYCKKAAIVAAGCWTGSLIHQLLKDSNFALDVPVKPRKGHLLVLENFNLFNLKHGLMEVGYVDHQGQSTSALGEEGQVLSVSMTATIDSQGSLVLGSSRQFAGFSTEVEESILIHIWKRAGVFFPKLRELCLEEFTDSRSVRVGLRPFMGDGKPVIGAVPGLSKVFLATGHEGGGLSMALGTAEMVVDMVLETPLHVDSSPFAVQGQII